VGVVLVSSQNYVIPRAFSLTEPCTNNVTEYNALIIGMQPAEEIGVKHLEEYGDSKLIINQVRGEYEVRHEDLIHYHKATVNLAENFKIFYIDHLPHQ
jgi:ribonuclease HI